MAPVMGVMLLLGECWAVGEGASPDGAGLSPSVEPVPVSPPAGASIPDAGNSSPDWYEVAKAMAFAIMFQRSTRSEHVVGRDGRTRMGMIDLFGCYIVDDAAREFCELAGLPFQDVDAPNEHQAFYMSVMGMGWADWFTRREEIVSGAGRSPGKGKVDMNAIAKAMSARQSQDPQGLGPQDASAVPQAFAPTPSPNPEPTHD